MAAADRHNLAEFMRRDFTAILRELDEDLHLMGQHGGLGPLPADFRMLLSRPLDALPMAADVIEQATEELDRQLVAHDLADVALEIKTGIIRNLRTGVSDARERLMKNLANGSRAGLAWLRKRWEALLDAVNALVGSAIDALTAAHLPVAGLQVGKEAKDFGAAIVKIVR